MIGIINGSPKAAHSNSGLVADIIQGRLGNTATTVIPTFRWEPGVFDVLDSCEAIILIFPLYVDALPSHLLRFLVEYETSRTAKQSGKLPFYAIGQCGFYEGRQNGLALAVLENFCERAGLLWNGGIGIGGGGCLAASNKSWEKPVVELVEEVVKAVELKQFYRGNPYTSIGIPRLLYVIGGNLSWGMTAKQYHLKRKDLYKRNYTDVKHT